MENYTVINYKGFEVEQSDWVNDELRHRYYIQPCAMFHDGRVVGYGLKKLHEFIDGIGSERAELIGKIMTKWPKFSYIIRSEFRASLERMTIDQLKNYLALPTQEERIAQNRAKVDLTKRYDSSTWKNV